MKYLNTKEYILKMECEDCGHIQYVEPATVMVDDDDKLHAYYGSAYDFCDECDGVPIIIDRGVNCIPE